MKIIKKLLSVVASVVFMMSYLPVGAAYAAGHDNYPDDPYLGTYWQFAKAGIDTTWNGVDSNNEIVVAVLDTGLDTNLSDLQGRIASGYDYVRNTSAVIDTEGHGTMVSSCIAATADNGIGIAGAAGTANVKIAPYRIGDGTLNNDSIYNALIAAANREDVRIINLSFGSYEYNERQAEAIAYALSKGKIIIACAGNHGAEKDGVDPYYYPASYLGVISVGAMGINGEIASFSQYNDTVDLYAPGEGLILLGPDDNFVWESGTSFSAAIVSGICANLLAQDPSLTASDVESLLQETAVNFGETGQYPSKLVRADKALDELKSRTTSTNLHAYNSLSMGLSSVVFNLQKF